MKIQMQPIGYVSNDSGEVPRNWTVSNVEGSLVMNEGFEDGLRDLEPGQRIFVLFQFHQSPEFTERYMRIKPPLRQEVVGVFSTHSPFRPNPIGLSVLEITGVEGNVIRVKGLDMLDQTPILDIKPEFCP
jgi:tRNA-Thr(GGU) m(6)t(6)A37 methyltransferase TsaA